MLSITELSLSISAAWKRTATSMFRPRLMVLGPGSLLIKEELQSLEKYLLRESEQLKGSDLLEKLRSWGCDYVQFEYIIIPTIIIELQLPSPKRIDPPQKRKEFLYYFQKLKINSCSMNNQPYILPDQPLYKPTYVYPDSNASYIKPSDSDNSDSHYQQRFFNASVSFNSHLRKSTVHPDDTSSMSKSPSYHPAGRDLQPYFPSPKNQQNSSSTSSFASTLSPRGHMLSRNSLDKRDESTAKVSAKEGLGISFFEFKELSDKVESMLFRVKNNEQRISDLQKSSSTSSLGFLPNNSEVSNIHEEAILNGIVSMENEIKDKFSQIKSQIDELNSKVTIGKLSQSQPRIDEKIIAQKVKQLLTAQDYLRKEDLNEEVLLEKVRNEINNVRKEIESKAAVNFEKLNGIYGKLQRDIQNVNVSSLSTSSIKTSGIKCSGSAILLRFVQSFRVRKNNNTSKAETKILLTDNTYYIDCEGYLLDKEQCYLVDSNSQRIRLEERHLMKLRDEKILL